MKWIIVLLLIVPFTVQSQSALDSANGFKIFKFGASVKDFTGKITSGSEGIDKATQYQVLSPDQYKVGSIELKSITLLAYRDTVRAIMIITDELNGTKLAQAYYDRYGFPNKANTSIYSGYAWQGNAVELQIRSTLDEYVAFYRDSQYFSKLEKETKTANAGGL